MRQFRMIATPVLLLALLGFLIWGMSWGWKNLTAPLPSPSPTPCVTTEATVVTPAHLTVNVLNGGFTSGLAGTVAQHLKDSGFEVLRTANTDERIAETIVRGNKDSEAALQLLQSHFKGSTIDHDDRVDGTLDVLVGTAYAGLEPNPLPEVEAPGGVVCEYASPSPSASDSAAPPEPTTEG